MKHVCILGSGPAGATAAIYLARAGIQTTLLAGFYSGPAGGQLMTTTEVENYPGFPDGITGPALMEKMLAQAARFGTKIVQRDAKTCQKKGALFEITDHKGEHYLVDAVVVATGATAKTLPIPGKEEFWQKGITACAVCDGASPIFRDKVLAVVGGGDTAMEEALFLTKFASKVLIIHRRAAFRASAIMSKRVLEHPKIEVLWNHTVTQALGLDLLQSIKVTHTETKIEQEIAVAGLFFAIGHQPNSALVADLVACDPQGYILPKIKRCGTSCDGIFACGDIIDPTYRQAVTAAGSGCQAALECEHWLQTCTM